MYGRLLIIADTITANRISRMVQRDSWTVDSAQLGQDCLDAVLRLKPELVILDARQRTQVVVEFCRCIRSIDEMAIGELVALIRHGQHDFLDLLEAGADDCWVEPIETHEFQIRLTAIYRRLNRPKTSRLLRRGGVELDLDRYTARSSGPPVRLTVKQVNVLKYLMEHAGVVVSRTDLLERALGNAELGECAVRTCIRRLRQVLRATGAVNVIRTVSGGYLFDSEVAPVKVPWARTTGAADYRSK